MWQFKSITIQNLFSVKQAEYIFTNGIPIVIIGENKDWRKSGQKVNGAGKSIFLEAISIALIGRSLRKLKNADIVRNGQTQCAVAVELYNTKTKDVLEIVRGLSRKESSSVGITLNDIDISGSFPDPNAANKFIIEKIGISADDLLNYYIISRERFVSFLSSSDTAKKELINRFSKADRLNQLDVVFEQKLGDIEEHKLQLDHNMAVYLGNLEVLQNQLRELQSVSFEERKQKVLDELNTQYGEQDAKISEINFQITEHQKTIDEQREKLKLLDATDLQSQDTKLKKDETDIEVLIYNIKRKISNIQDEEFADEANELKELEKALNNDIKILAGKIKDHEIDLAAFEKELLAFVECPKCHHKFSIKKTSLTHSDVAKMIEADKKIIADSVNEQNSNEEAMELIDEQKTELQQKIDQRRKQLQDEINNHYITSQQLAQQRHQLSLKIQEIKQKQDTCNFYIKGAENHIVIKNRTLKTMDEALNHIAEQILKAEDMQPDNKAQEIQLQIKDIDDKREALKIVVQENEEQHMIVSQWQLNFKSFKSFLANKSISAINVFVNHFLEKINSNLSLVMNGYKMNAKKQLKEEITVEVFRNLVPEGDVKKFSGGEKARIDLCCIFALRKLINLSARTGGLDFLGIDEIIDQVDSYGLGLIIDSLKNLGETIFIISQLQIDTYTNTIKAVKEDDITELIY